MFLVVYSIQSPKGFKCPARCQQDFIPTWVHGHKLSNVIDAAFVSHPHTIFQRAVLCDFFLPENGKRGGLVYGLRCVSLLSLHRRDERQNQFCNLNCANDTCCQTAAAAVVCSGMSLYLNLFQLLIICVGNKKKHSRTQGWSKNMIYWK